MKMSRSAPVLKKPPLCIAFFALRCTRARLETFLTSNPSFTTTLARRPCTPVNNSFLRNAACNATVLIDASAADLASWDDAFVGNTNAPSC